MVHGGVDLLTARALSLLAGLALTERKAPPTAAA